MLQHIGGNADTAGKGDNANTVFRYAELVAHANAPDAGNTRIQMFQRRYMRFKLFCI